MFSLVHARGVWSVVAGLATFLSGGKRFTEAGRSEAQGKKLPCMPRAGRPGDKRQKPSYYSAQVAVFKLSSLCLSIVFSFVFFTARFVLPMQRQSERVMCQCSSFMSCACLNCSGCRTLRVRGPTCPSSLKTTRLLFQKGTSWSRFACAAKTGEHPMRRRFFRFFPEKKIMALVSYKNLY